MNDRSVEIKSGALAGQRVDLLVSGGIAAIESPRLARELRRHGALVRAVMTPASQKFITPLTLEWATEQSVVTDLSGGAEHISTSDFVVVAPATLDFVAKSALGIADNAALTFLQSALARKPIIFVPTMHESLEQNPLYREHKLKLSRIKDVYFLEPRREESKAKSPSPEDLVESICHWVSPSALRSKRVLVTLGSTQSPIDDVRFVSNFSSGALGSLMSREFFRRGAQVRVIAGPARVLPAREVPTVHVRTNLEMKSALAKEVKTWKPHAVIFAAAVLDFDVVKARPGKTSSQENFNIALKPSSKLISAYKTAKFLKVGFKLESQVSEKELLKRAWESLKANKADWVVANRLEDVSATGSHKAFILNSKSKKEVTCSTKAQIAENLADQLSDSF